MEPEPHRRALIVEGDTTVRRLLRAPLDDLGFTVLDVGDGLEGVRRAHDGRFDVVLVDVAVPGLDGMAVCRAIRASGPNVHTPLLMLSTRARDSDAIDSLESGADDFVAAPFRPRELQARVGALLRRRERTEHDPPASLVLPLGWRLDARQRALVDTTRSIPLTPREFAVLGLLAARADQVVSRDRLRRDVWGEAAPPDNRVVDLLISRLRKKIESNPRRPRMIRTVWGVGYRLLSD